MSNITFKKEVSGCPRCNISGGVLSLYRNVSKEDDNDTCESVRYYNKRDKDKSNRIVPYKKE